VSSFGTIFVPAQCSTIQQAINVANSGDIVYVSSGTYREQLTLNKTVHLIGTNPVGTYIEGQRQGTVVTITANSASISGFSVEGSNLNGKEVLVNSANFVRIGNCTIASNLTSSSPTGIGIELYRANYTLIHNNQITLTAYGVNITSSNHNEVSNNAMGNLGVVGARLSNSSMNLLIGNSFVSGRDGVELLGMLPSSWNNVTRNLVKNSGFAGILLANSTTGNIVNENIFQLNHIALDLERASGNVFYHNSFLASNLRHVNHAKTSDIPLNQWDNRSFTSGQRGGNYWDNYTGTDMDNDGIGDNMTPWNGVDLYPLMSPFLPVPLAFVSVVATPQYGSAPLTVRLSANALGTLKPFRYIWDFGDGSPHSNATSPSHTYSSPGRYVVSVLVDDSSGARDGGSLVLSVGASSSLFDNLYLVLAAGLALAATVVGILVYRKRQRQAMDASAATVQGKKKERKESDH
jgi:parallel beta-helix repeat protein